MTLIVCVDDDLGMAFGGRRQSRDRTVCEDILRLARGTSIHMDGRSARLFEGMGGNIAVSENFPESAAKGEFCFAELQPVTELAKKAERIVLYRWNRRYPASLHFDVPLADWRLTETVEFAGSSHEKITREVYTR